MREGVIMYMQYGTISTWGLFMYSGVCMKVTDHVNALRYCFSLVFFCLKKYIQKQGKKPTNEKEEKRFKARGCASRGPGEFPASKLARVAQA